MENTCMYTDVKVLDFLRDDAESTYTGVEVLDIVHALNCIVQDTLNLIEGESRCWDFGHIKIIANKVEHVINYDTKCIWDTIRITMKVGENEYIYENDKSGASDIFEELCVFSFKNNIRCLINMRNQLQQKIEEELEIFLKSKEK